MSTTGQTATKATWNVDVGTTAQYWLDSLTLTSNASDGSPANFAAILSDSNRTQYLFVTDVTDTSINYTLGLFNGSMVTPPLFVEMQEISLGVTSAVFPSTFFSFILPVSTADHSNYLQTYAATIDSLKFLIQNFDFSTFNITTPPTVNFDGNFGTQFMNVTGSIGFDNLNASIGDVFSLLGNTTSFDLGGFGNITDATTFDSVSLDVNLAYNRTDGVLQDILVSASTMSTIVTETGNETISQEIALHMERTAFLNPSDLPDLPDNVSQKAKSFYPILGVLPATLIYTFLRRKQK